MGGLKIQDPIAKIEGLQLNFLQKVFRNGAEGSENIRNVLNCILEEHGAPTSHDHIVRYGPTIWKATARKIKSSNDFLSQVFETMAAFLSDLENDVECWPGAAVVGHSQINPIFQFSAREKVDLEVHNIKTVLDLFEMNFNITLKKEFRDFTTFQLSASLISKLRNLFAIIRNNCK